jgi:hypothetical protein
VSCAYGHCRYSTVMMMMINCKMPHQWLVIFSVTLHFSSKYCPCISLFYDIICWDYIALNWIWRNDHKATEFLFWGSFRHLSEGTDKHHENFRQSYLLPVWKPNQGLINVSYTCFSFATVTSQSKRLFLHSGAKEQYPGHDHITLQKTRWQTSTLT